ncbi:MAG: hypothetical protein ACFE9I_15750 [Candidatus Hermodarchaeota archaeon]
MIRKAHHLFRNGREIESQEVLLEAQEIHTEFSPIFKRVEPRIYKQMITDIRSGLNRVLDDEILSFYSYN